MARRSVTKAMRVRIFDRAHGVCHLCGLKIAIGEAWEADHVKPLWCGGEDDERNMAPAHVDCHATKSRGDAAPKAKADRQRANHLGVTNPPAKRIESRGFTKVVRPSKIAAERIEKVHLPRRGLFGESE